MTRSETKKSPLNNVWGSLPGKLLLIGICLLASATSLYAWPADDQWIGLVKGVGPLSDSEDDATGSRNVVPNDGSNYAAYINNDGTYLNYRIRLDADPSGTGGQGILQPYGWGFELDTNQDPSNYEWIIIVDGIAQNEVVSLRKNTTQSNLGDPSDKAEYVAAEYPLSGNYRITLAPDTCVGDADLSDGCDDPDYFLDFRIPYAVFLAETEVTEDTLVRYFVGSSSAANALVENGADLVGGSSLYEGLTNYYVPDGEIPDDVIFYDAEVNFVDSPDGFNDLSVARAGQTLYIRVDDLDQTVDTNPGQTVVVEITTPGGDAEYLTLTATGVSGKFTGSIGSEQVASVSSGKNGDLYDGLLQLVPDETITVTFLDAIAADLSQNYSRTDTILITATQIDLELNKSVNPENVQQNDSVDFTIVVNNKGPFGATGVAVTDLLPAGVNYTSYSSSLGTYDSGTGIWTVGALNYNSTTETGDSATLTITAQATAANGSVTNNANISALIQTDGYTANDSASATVYIGGTDLRITKSVDNAYPAELDLITFTISALNLGPNSTGGIAVEDILPSGLSYNSTTGYTATQGTYNTANGLWTVGTLASGVGASLTIPVDVQDNTADTIITNTSSLYSSTEVDTNSSNDSDSVDIKVNFHDLEMTKQAAIGPGYSPYGSSLAPDENDQVRYLLTLTNNGPNNATGIEVTDLLPPEVSYNSATASQGTYNSTTGIWTVGDVSDGVSATLQVDTRVVIGTAGQTAVNNAEITASDHLDDDSSNNGDSVTLKIAGTDLMLTKTVSSATPSPGDAIIYNVVITNNGPNIAYNIAVIDMEPTGISFSSSTETQGSFDGTGGNPSYIWDVGTLAITASATLTISATVDTGTSGNTITNVTMITASDQEDPNTLNNVASVVINVDGTDLGLTKTVDDAAPNEGDLVTYTITLSNSGPGDATGVQVTDLLPPEVTYNSIVSASGYNSTTDTWTVGSGYIPGTGIWTVGDAYTGYNSSATLQLAADVKPATSGLTITNTASITAFDQGDQNPANDSASAAINVAGTDLILDKTVDDAAPGELDVVNYTITVTNNGVNGATGIEVEDVLPTGVTYLADTPSQGSYSTGTWLVGTLAASYNATLTIQVGVNAGTAYNSIINTATITALDQADENATNDYNSATITPTIAPSLTVVKSSALTSGAFHIPGASVRYSIRTTNSGGGTTDDNTLSLSDTLPTHTNLIVTGTPIVTFNYQDYVPANGQGLTYDSATDICYSQTTCPGAAPKDCTNAAFVGYTPSDDGTGIDPTVRCVRVVPQGILEASTAAGDPYFDVTFEVRIE